MPGKSSKTVVTQIRLQNELDARITEASEASGLAKNDIIKISLEAGLKWLQANNYDLTRGITPRDILETADTFKDLLDTAIARLIADAGKQQEATRKAKRLKK